ncbi:SgcJ/EcaC family oxidoreductase [Nocardia sp. NPDC004604]|uniref:SgcJ/EcaC family oxidoreductase n=1 Tax=Nocardia sp. NPDC004604 TaxID=3157013 RepID=UPI0033A31E1A
MIDTERTVATVLDGWKAAIDNHEPEKVASFFTHDALFQGFRPTYSIGRQGVADYYASQPLGLSADYRILETRQLSDDVIVGYQTVDFGFTDRPTLPVHLTVILRNIAGTWLISHYHVSKID